MAQCRLIAIIYIYVIHGENIVKNV